MRLQKFISRTGYCSRRHAEELILNGKVTVNGQIVTQLGTKVDPEKDKVTVEGTPVSPEENLVYIALNKPKGYVTSCSHPGEKIVLELVNIPQDLSGRPARQRFHRSFTSDKRWKTSFETDPSIF
jgi:23S rRNA pseudouridine2605 synthase